MIFAIERMILNKCIRVKMIVNLIVSKIRMISDQNMLTRIVILEMMIDQSTQLSENHENHETRF